MEINNLTPLFEALSPFRHLSPKPALHHIDEHTYMPKVFNPKSDWVASVAVPAFEAYQMKSEKRGGSVKSFCTIGTGSGADALAAIEIFDPAMVVVSDVHESVVLVALSNIEDNLLDHEGLVLKGEVGNLCVPLFNKGFSFDLIYENLPNIPAQPSMNLYAERNTCSFYAPAGSSHDIPASVRRDLLELHFICLKQARSLLTPNGRVLCSIGGRRPLHLILAMVHDAGYKPHVLTYTWKIQSEAEDIIPAYAEYERHNGVPFYFYPIEILKTAFECLSPAMAARFAYVIEQSLQPHALKACEVVSLLQKGSPVGHTVAVVEGEPL